MTPRQGSNASPLLSQDQSRPAVKAVLTDRVYVVFRIASEESRRRQSTRIVPMDVLRALICEHNGVAAKVLLRLLKAHGDVRFSTSASDADWAVKKGRESLKRLSCASRRVLKLAKREARRLGRELSNELGFCPVGTEHLLLAILSESARPAGRLLRKFFTKSGLNAEDTRSTVLRFIGSSR